MLRRQRRNRVANKCQRLKCDLDQGTVAFLRRVSPGFGLAELVVGDEESVDVSLDDGSAATPLLVSSGRQTLSSILKMISQPATIV
jgi:hypothetical protein